MRAYVMTTGALFGLLTVAHVLRMLEEGRVVAANPWYILITIASASLGLWALRLLRVSARR